jgi:hypothetical protein
MKTRDLAVIGLVVLLGLGFWTLVSSSSTSYATEVARAIAKDKPRFTPENNLDIAMAMGLITHDPPQMLNPPSPGPLLLLYPPSAKDLEKLSGPATSPESS